MKVAGPELLLVVGGGGEGFVPVGEVHVGPAVIVGVEQGGGPCPAAAGHGDARGIG